MKTGHLLPMGRATPRRRAGGGGAPASRMAGNALVVAPAVGAPTGRALQAGTVYAVNTTEDIYPPGECTSEAGGCSLREAILAANLTLGQDNILVPAGTYRLLIAGSKEDEGATGDLDIRDDLTLVGSAGFGSIIDGNRIENVFHVLEGVHVEMLRLIIQGGDGDNGGGIINEGNLTLTACTVRRNRAGSFGGGIYTHGSLTLRDSAVLDNDAPDGGGLMVNDSFATLISSQVILNRAASGGGGIYTSAHSASVSATNSTIARNVAAGGGGVLGNVDMQNSILAQNEPNDCEGGLYYSFGHSIGGNLNGCTVLSDATDVWEDPKLGSFADGGQPGHAYLPLLPDSPAIDSGSNLACPPTDQLGRERVDGDGDSATVCDIGSVEYQPPSSGLNRFRGYTYQGRPLDGRTPIPGVVLLLYGRNEGESPPGKWVKGISSDGSGFFNFYITPADLFDTFRLVALPPPGMVGTGVWSEDGAILDNLTVEWVNPKPEVHMNEFYFDVPTASATPTPTGTATVTPTPSPTITPSPTGTPTPTATITPTETPTGMPSIQRVWLPLILTRDSLIPSVTFSTYLGGDAIDFGDEVDMDAAGNIYVCGGADSRDFPTTSGAYDTTHNGDRDVFVAKYDPDGRLLASTLLGGGSLDSCNALAVDEQGNAYIGGVTYSHGFPFTDGQGGGGAFIAKFDPTLTTLVASKAIGVSGAGVAWGMDLDASGGIWTTGDSFIARFNSDLTQLCGKTLPGDEGYDIAAANSYGYAVGQTFSRGSRDGFVAKYDGYCNLVYSLAVGGSDADWFMDVEVDDQGRAYAFGDTTSSDYPTTANAFQSAGAGDQDGVITVMNAAGDDWIYSSYFGGSSYEYALGGGLDAQGNAFIAGVTDSTDLPMADALQAISGGGGDIFLAKLQIGEGDAHLPLLLGTYFGGSSKDSAYGMMSDRLGTVVLTGVTDSSDYPTRNPAQPSYAGGGEDVIITKFAPDSTQVSLCSTQTDIPQAECETLVALYNSTNGPNWSDSPANGWNVTQSPCSWTGVTCSEGNPQHVSGIVRVEMQLAGAIPDLTALDRLEELSLAGNQLGGSIPTTFPASLMSLELGGNYLRGNIPDLSHLTKLTHLNLSWNEMTGSIPPSLPPNLEVLDLSWNLELSGGFPDLSHLTRLKTLSLSFTGVSGGITTNLPTSLEELIMNFTGANGGISGLSRLTNLHNLNLAWNGFDGSIPDISGLTSLELLDLSNNQLSGSIPNLSALSNLSYLTLQNNQLSGGIPDCSALTNLRTVDLSGNRLIGGLHEAWPRSLEYLFASGNQLGGSFPDLSALASLKGLSLSGNQLSGPIPVLSALGALVTLDLHNNQLSGTIPDFSTLTNLYSLDLASNRLNGSIPDLPALPRLESLFLQNNQLEGTIPAGVCHASYELDLGYNGLTGEDDPCVTKEDPDWAATQTVPPAKVQALRLSSTSVELTWTPILYTGDGGYYEVRCGATSGGPYASQGITADKTAAGLILTDLAPDTPAYCVVRTVTPRHDYQQNDLISIDSAEVVVTTAPALMEPIGTIAPTTAG